MAETHELRLKINATGAESGAKKFTGAVESIKRAVRELDRDSSGAFTKLRRVDASGLKTVTREATNTAKATTAVERETKRLADQMKRTALSASSSYRTSQNEVQRLTERFAALDKTDAIDRLNRELIELKSNLTGARSGLDVRSARSGFSDTSSELKRLANDLEAEARAHRQAADAANTHKAQLENLAQKYDPIRANSMRYATSLKEIETLEKAGILSSTTAGQARERASQALLSTSAANTAFAASSRHAGMAAQQMGYQINDVFTMAALGASPMQVVASQIFQVSQAMDIAGGKAQALNSVRTALLNLLTPTNLVVAGVIGLTAAAVSWGASALKAGKETKSFEDRLKDLSTAVTTYRGYADTASQSTSELIAKFGAFGTQAGSASAALATIGRLDAIRSADSAVAALTERFGGLSRSALTYADAVMPQIEATFLNLKDTLAITDVQAAAVVRSLEGLATADSMQAKVDAANALNESFVRVFGSVEAIPEELLNVQREALLVALQVAEIGEVQSDVNKKIGAAAKLYAQTRTQSALATSTANEMLASLRQQADTNKLIATYGRDSVQVAEARIHAERAVFAESTKTLDVLESMKAELMDAWETANGVAASNMAGNISSASQAAATLARNLGVALEAAVSLGNAQSAKEYGGRGQDPRLFGDGGRLSASNYQADQSYTSVEKLISDLSKSERKGGESRQLEKLSKQVNDRVFKLGQENAALDLLATGQASTRESAELMAAAMSLGGGAIDGQTYAMIRQFEAAQVLNEELKRLARDPVKDWIASVPSWTEAGRQIETQVFDSLSNAIANFAMTGKVDFESLGQSILSTATRVIADMAVKEMIGMLGGNVAGSGGSGGFNFGAVIGSFFAAEGGLTSNPSPVNAGPMVSPAAFRHAPHFSSGTPNTSGIPSILHPNEAVIPLSKGRKIPVEMPTEGAGGTSVSVIQNFNVQSDNPDSFRRSQRQIAADAGVATQRAMKKIR
ncbi:phage tail length tape measure family protein [Ruegeria sp. 2012CJ41-6]|uniref:Phage tail length tape measure family protein n=1 Tax=Ruegeria spongiae TaxID=2942209 RepID=A0ABT0Q203_9RHOB|nr:phage tail length tape measure family protein [Ruegeria spongiae]MCL6283632.1 phage tail length tape measure family protein [Ruegeria spongiae]